jgi:hypothetical protein
VGKSDVRWSLKVALGVVMVAVVSFGRGCAMVHLSGVGDSWIVTGSDVLVGSCQVIMMLKL